MSDEDRLPTPLDNNADIAEMAAFMGYNQESVRRLWRQGKMKGVAFFYENKIIADRATFRNWATAYLAKMPRRRMGRRRAAMGGL